MIALAAVLASAAGVIGLYISYYLSIASGAAIVLSSTAFFALAWAGRTIHRAVRQRSLQAA
jgi:ABC-type Mn2+/Zn2+ transport system permease subunit